MSRSAVWLARPMPGVVGHVRRVVVGGHRDDVLHLKAVLRKFADPGHEADELVEIVLPAGKLIMAGHQPTHVLCEMLGDQIALPGGERRVRIRYLLRR